MPCPFLYTHDIPWEPVQILIFTMREPVRALIFPVGNPSGIIHSREKNRPDIYYVHAIGYVALLGHHTLREDVDALRNLLAHQQTIWPTGSGPVCIQISADATSVGGQIRLRRRLVSSEGVCQMTQGADVILLAPVWKAQSCYPLLLSMLADWLRLLPKQLTRAHTQSILVDPQLVVWSISGRDSAVKALRYRPYPQIMEDKDEQILRLTLWAMESLV